MNYIPLHFFFVVVVVVVCTENSLSYTPHQLFSGFSVGSYIRVHLLASSPGHSQILRPGDEAIQLELGLVPRSFVGSLGTRSGHITS